jgi:hypothetical protein
MGTDLKTNEADSTSRWGRDLPGADVERLDCLATGELADAGDDFVAMMEDLVADDRMGREDDQAAAFDAGGMGVGGVGGADQGGPLIADRLLGRRAADLVFDHQLVDEGVKVFGRALEGAAGFFVGDAAEVADEFLGEFAEGVRRVRHRA